MSKNSLVSTMARGLLAALMAACALGAAAQTAPSTIVIGMGPVPRHLNSAVQSGIATGIPATQIFASPLRFDKDWNAQPYLAESWVFQDDGKSLLLRLVPGATFHDGKPITSEDVAFSIMAIKANHPFQSMFEPVERVDTPTPQIAIIRLKQPHPAILLALSPAFCPIIPKHIFDDGQNLQTHPRNVNPVGSGPFKVVAFNPREAIVLERYAGFFIKDRPKVDRLIIRIIPDTAAQALALERGEIDLLGEAIGPLGWLAFNLKKKPFDDVRVRQAIGFAMDKDFIVRQLHQGKTLVATGPIAQGSPFYTDKVEPYKMNLDKAAKLLDAAGLKAGANGKRFAMAIDFLPNTPDNSQTIAEYLRPQLAKIGIEVSVRSSPDFPTWARRVSTYDFDATVDGAFNYGDPVIGVHRTYLSSNIKQGVIWSNTQNYANPKVDELLAQATVERDIEKRKKLYAEFQRLVVSDAPVLFTHVWAQGYAARKDLVDIPQSIWAPLAPYDTMSRKR
jgi:peptide/nickel transport system substrate-binding protein